MVMSADNLDQLDLSSNRGGTDASPTTRILIVDDERGPRESLRMILAPNHEISVASNGAAALELLATDAFDLVTVDINMPGMRGDELMRTIRELYPQTEVIIITGFREIENAFRAMRQGAFDFFTKPLKVQELSASLQRTLRFRALRQDKERLERLVAGSQATGMGEILGECAAIEEVREQRRRGSQAGDATVLIRGETGTGKELVARAVHDLGERSNGPFVAVNCAAIPENLIESELFGHERGAFTGAIAKRKGRFELAQGGTLFLDEVGELAIGVQAKLLRVLQERQFQRVGGTKTLDADIRIVAATNRDLRKAVEEGGFRDDLYYRLNVFPIRLPPLRDRPEDIPLIATALLERIGAAMGRGELQFSADVIRKLQAYCWPGNVRELKNVVERAVVLARGEYIDLDDLALSKLSTAGDTAEIAVLEAGPTEPRSLADVERDHILAMLESTGWNKSQAAGILGIKRSTLDRKIRRYDLATQQS